jgi:FkbM family methyltransferase
MSGEARSGGPTKVEATLDLAGDPTIPIGAGRSHAAPPASASSYWRRLTGRLRDAAEAARPLLGAARSVSFSQYGEDLLLAVSLLPGRKGFYVDVGAYHPSKQSNTYRLYLRGWSGLTIEPNPDAAPLFKRLRPRDTHLVSGVARERGTLTYYRFLAANLNTFSADQAALYAGQGSTSLDALTVECRPLQDTLDDHGVAQVDLLSVDCEGLDLAVLQSLDFNRTRPTAILIEDYEGFERLRRGAGASAIEEHLRAADYAHIGQAMFSSLYVDLRALQSRRVGAFNLAAVQF